MPADPTISIPTEPEVEEVRVAMALNGGVSLAVWMGGCVVELDHARRAHAPSGEPARVYDSLCKCFGRTLVIDILCGASAGGINGALLSAAMVRGRKLDVEFVRKQWLELGELSDLLYPSTKDDPRSLMDGELFHKRLQSTFEGVLGTGNPKTPGYAECATKASLQPTVPSLDVTMTDIAGVEKSFKDTWGGELIAREHRPRFKFREAAHFNAEALAAAARTSASFPVAFEPWLVKGDPRVLAGLSVPSYGMDGGLLDNAPIKAALDLIPSKRADSRVRRYVCYLNGDPVMPSDDQSKGPPSLRDVGGYTINLPRTAPFVDQLYAIKRAVERPRLAKTVQLRLLQMDIDQLRGVADALFDTYRERRTMESLEELLGDPGTAATMNELLGNTNGFLPWIPFSMAAPPGAWRWGIRPAQRILHLLLDLLRSEIRAAEGTLRGELLAVRSVVDAQLAALNDARETVLMPQHENNPARFSEETPLERLEKAVARSIAQAPEAYAAIEAAATALHNLLTNNPDALGGSPARSLLGGADDAWFSDFLLRVLAIEVIRRAFATEAEIESAEDLHFVQLTPAAPSPIFTSGPLRLRSPASAGEKLAGVGLGHFAGFYRRSWRANDFMWGRLDAAARIVDLLLDRPSDEVGVGLDPGEDRDEVRSECLTEALLPKSPKDCVKPDLETRRWLLREALADAATSGEASADRPPDYDPRQDVKARIKAELEEAGPGAGVEAMPFTRAVFQRAAQLEVVADELNIIRTEATADRALGSGGGVFLPDGQSATLEVEIEAVRALYEKDSSLPHCLIDDEEAVSDLGLRTITHAAFVALSAVRTAGAPLAKFLGVVRTPLSAVAATVAEDPLYRIAAGAGFWAAAIYLTGRLVTANADASPQIASVWTLATLTALVAALGAIGIAAVPILRLWRKVHPLRNFLTALGLVGAAFGFVTALALIFGSFDLEKILFPPEAKSPPDLVLGAPLFILSVISASRLPIPGWLGPATKLFQYLRTTRVIYLLAAATFGLLGVWAGIDLWRAAFDGGAWWQAAGAILALVMAPIVVTASLTRWTRRR